MAMNVVITRSDVPSVVIEMLQPKCNLRICNTPFLITQKETFLNKIEGAHAIYCTETDTIDRDILDAAGPQLKVISTASLNYDHIDIEECKRRKIAVTNVPLIDEDCVAEFAVGLLIVVTRRIAEASNAITRGEWIDNCSANHFSGKGLKNSVVGIMGMRTIGLAILKRILPFEVKELLYYDWSYPNVKAEQLGAVYSSFQTILKKSDFVIVSPDLEDTDKEIFNVDTFNVMRNSAIFINIGSAELVQQDDLYDALKNNQIRAAGLDVTVPKNLPENHKLLSLPNIVICPRIASSEYFVNIEKAKLNARNILSILQDDHPLTPVYYGK